MKKTNSDILLAPEPALFDPALVIKPIPSLIIGDTHCPYQNKDLLLSAIDIAKSLGVKQVIHAGDIIDGASYSTQAKQEPHYPIEIERDHAKSLLDVLTLRLNSESVQCA